MTLVVLHAIGPGTACGPFSDPVLQSFAVVGECCGLRNRPQSAPTRSAMASAEEPAGLRTAKVPPIHAVVRQRALICPSARLPLAPYASRQAGSRGFGA